MHGPSYDFILGPTTIWAAIAVGLAAFLRRANDCTYSFPWKEKQMDAADSDSRSSASLSVPPHVQFLFLLLVRSDHIYALLDSPA